MIRNLTGLLAPAGDRARLSILILHRVCPQPDPLFPGEIHARSFDAMLRWVKDWYSVLPLPEAVERLRAGTLPARALAITFDDGYEDNHSVALPILRQHGLTATFFVATGFLNGGRMWNDGLIESMRTAPGGELDLGQWGRHRLDDAASRSRAALALIGRIKYLEPEARQAAVEEVAQRSRATLPGNLMMTDAQVADLHRQGMTVGAHTCSHPILARLDDAAAREEIAQGRAMLQDIIGARVGLFAYPNGKPGEDYLGQHVRMVRELGFDAAVSTAWGASQAGDDVLQLRRFTPWDRSRLKFGVRMLRNLAKPAPTPLMAA
ncbi:polysaccharide deacetylase family protein [Uliginosibacterium sp. H1]|uniref:polysaccharide deacetylase family protein n=1 Tax=Uliginosibacterium sp. H1 TaxID=3114757 RepID=UPI002E19A566|nr:polysaccharide deacetylase family protein [Uliginosibacterium sp. H1]